jgi:peptidoglycan/xylan/chitin deacetylase (PgdA/CDA1 family)
LPSSPILLTFDDGYLDHYRYVFPLLDDAKISGAFFAPATAVLDRRVLDVNKIHFILASVPDKNLLVETMEAELADAGVGDRDTYRQQYWSASRHDSPDVRYFKQLLQHALPKPLRSSIVDRLFRRFVTTDEQGFAEDLYVNVDQLRSMSRAGMHIGSHADKHEWLDRMTVVEQEQEIDRSMRLFDALGLPRDGFTFCAPYGGYNAETLTLLRARGCAAAVTTRVELAQVGHDSILELPRLDTNDLPKDRNAETSRWTRAAHSETAL